MKNYPFNNFRFGLFNQDPVQSIPDGAAYDSNNWLTTPGKIELVRGYARLGLTELTGSGRVSGLIVGIKASSVEVPFRSRGKKVEYYDSVLDEWTEISSDILGTAADGEDITFAKFDSRSGKQVLFNSPNSGPKKIMVANPGDYTDLYDSSKNYKAWMRIIGGQAYNWNISNQDRNQVRMSYLEVRSVTDYTQIVAEVLGVGNGTTLTFAATLAFKAGNSKRTCLDVSVTDGVETFSDNLDGTLTGSAGGTGTINYTTGAISVTFAVAPLVVNVTSTYRHVDESATSGIANFVVPGSRVSGDPNVFRQDTGGDIKNIFSLKEHRFVGHSKSIYDIQLTLNDASATNFLFRERQGIPSLRGGVEAPEGIYTVDVSDDANPRFAIIGYGSGSTEIRPFVISQRLNLTDYRFEKAVVFIWNDYVLFSCRYKDSAANDTVFVYHRRYKTFDKLDYAASCFDIYGGTLLAGDSLSNNVFTLFSGLDADGSVLYNYWKSGISMLATSVGRGKVAQLNVLKKSKQIALEGEIGPDQIIRMYVSLDRGSFVEILDDDGNPFIQGSGAYVDRSKGS
jgi:hypothetical protein